MGKIQQAEDRQQVLECIRNGAGLTAKEVSDQLKQEGEFGKWSTKRVAARLVLLEKAGEVVVVERKPNIYWEAGAVPMEAVEPEVRRSTQVNRRRKTDKDEARVVLDSLKSYILKREAYTDSLERRIREYQLKIMELKELVGR